MLNVLGWTKPNLPRAMIEKRRRAEKKEQRKSEFSILCKLLGYAPVCWRIFGVENCAASPANAGQKKIGRAGKKNKKAAQFLTPKILQRTAAYPNNLQRIENSLFHPSFFFRRVAGFQSSLRANLVSNTPERNFVKLSPLYAFFFQNSFGNMRPQTSSWEKKRIQAAIAERASEREYVSCVRASILGNHRGPKFGSNATLAAHEPRFRKTKNRNNLCASGLHRSHVSKRCLVILPKSACIWPTRVHLEFN